MGILGFVGRPSRPTDTPLRLDHDAPPLARVHPGRHSDHPALSAEAVAVDAREVHVLVDLTEQ